MLTGEEDRLDRQGSGGERVMEADRGVPSSLVDDIPILKIIYGLVV